MRILRSPSSAIDEWNALFQDEPELRHFGLLAVVFDCLQSVPDWANWMVVQPSGGVVVCALPPMETGSGWRFVGETKAWGCVESGEGWEGSLEAIDPAIMKLCDGRKVRYHCLKKCRRLLPDPAVAVTMDACGTVRAWADIPAVEGGKWVSPGKCHGIKLGVHAHPGQFNWKTLLYLHAEMADFSQGVLQ